MFKKATFFGTLVGLGFLLGAVSGAIAAEASMNDMGRHTTSQSGQIQRI